MDELLDGPLSQMTGAIQSGQVTSKQLVTAFLDRIEKVNGELNAVVLLTAEQALKHAEKADNALKNGNLMGRLHGIPMTIKDSLDTYDAVTTWGTTGRKEFRPGKDATCVSRLRGEGAILLGKTNTPEFTLWFQTDNLVYGRTNNPFDPSRTPGGSSGGAAAIIAAGASPFDIGTDTGGSIRLPAHFSGISGIKPTTGRVPCTGNALPSTGLIAPLSQPGPMARFVDDLTLLLEIIAGPDGIDPHAVEAVWHEPSSVDVSDLRIGFHTDNGILTPDEPIISAVSCVIDLLREDNINAAEARPTGIEMAGFIMNHVFTADGGEMLEALLEDCRTRTPSPKIQESIDHQPKAISDREFAQTLHLWHNYQSSMLDYFSQFDILICPVNAHTAIPHGQQEDMKAYTYTTAYNLTGWPGTVIRAGNDDNGLPVGVQILARPFREDHCLAVARWLQQRMPVFSPPSISATAGTHAGMVHRHSQ